MTFVRGKYEIHLLLRVYHHLFPCTFKLTNCKTDVGCVYKETHQVDKECRHHRVPELAPWSLHQPSPVWWGKRRGESDYWIHMLLPGLIDTKTSATTKASCVVRRAKDSKSCSSALFPLLGFDFSVANFNNSDSKVDLGQWGRSISHVSSKHHQPVFPPCCQSCPSCSCTLWLRRTLLSVGY